MKDDEKKTEKRVEPEAPEAKQEPKERDPNFVGYGEAAPIIDRDEVYVH